MSRTGVGTSPALWSCERPGARDEPPVQLAEIETFAVANPPPSFGGRYFLFVKVTASNGITGWGECYAAAVGANVQRAVIEDVFHRHCAGLGPHEVEKMKRRAYSAGFTQRPDPTIMGAFSAIEMASLDIVGKALERPVHALLGGKIHERVRAYTYLYPADGEDAATFYNDPDRSAEAAVRFVEDGFTAVKFDPAGAYTIHDPHQPSLDDIERSAAFCRAIREAVGTRADILFGTHGQFTPAGALRMAAAIAAYDPLWFEEPVPPDNFDAMARVASASHVPIAAGERLTTLAEFAPLLRAGVAIVQPALGRAGGLWEGKKIAALAEAHHAQVAPHLYCGPLEALANIALACTLPNFLVMEAIRDFSGFHGELLQTPIRMEEGHVIPSDEPGLGHGIDEAVVRANVWTGEGREDRLHLEMQDAPHGFVSNQKFAGG